MNYALSHGMIDLSDIQKQIEMTKRKEYLEQHQFQIWQGENDKKWYSYLSDEEKGRRLVKRNTRKELEDVVVQFYEDLDKRPFFREAYQRWIAEKEQFEEIGKNSITRYDNDFERFFPPNDPFCKIRLCDMTDSDLERFIKRKIKDNQLSAKSYAMLRLIINGVFKFAKREQYTTYSISTFFKDLSLPQNIFKKKKKSNSEQIFTHQEASRLIGYFEDNPSKVHKGLILEFLTGMRVGEIAALEAKDNIRPGIIHVSRIEITYKDKVQNKRITTVKDIPKTENGIRDIVIPQKAQDILNDLILTANGGYLFTKDGKRITERMFNYYLKQACEKIGIAPRSTHKIRKTYGSKLLSNHVDEAIVLGQMGHRDISTTRGYYHYDISDDVERRKKINEVVNF